MDSGRRLPKSRSELDFAFATAQQAELFSLIGNLIGAGHAAAYRDLCQLRSDRRYLTRSHLIAHLQREIDGSVLDVIAPPGLRNGGQNKNRERKISEICHMIGLDEHSELMIQWAKLEFHVFAHRRNYFVLEIKSDFDRQCDRYDAILFAVLKAFSSAFRINTDRVRTLLSEQRPSAHNVQTLRIGIPNHTVVFTALFENKLSPAWIAALFQHNYFETCPSNARAEALKYAATYADEDTEASIAIALRLPVLTSLEEVRQYFLLSLALPSKEASRLLPKIATWLQELKRPFNSMEQAMFSSHIGKLLHHVGDQHAASPFITEIIEYVSGYTLLMLARFRRAELI